MKKYLYILATAAIIVSCSEQDTFKKDIQAGEGEAILFESFTSKQTRAENSEADYKPVFFNHHTTFQVWGYKNTSATAVFNGDKVTVTSDEATDPTYTYAYSPIRYWDKAASMYEYYAAAPADPDYNKDNHTNVWTLVVPTGENGFDASLITTSAGQNKCYFTTSSTLTGTNLSATPATTYTYVPSFKAAQGDVDKLVADKKIVANAQFKDPVQLDFIHILSRLNVTIKKDASLEPANNINKQKVVMTELKVVNLKATGNFSEQTAAVATGSNTRWDQSNLDGSVTYNAVIGTDGPNSTAGTEVTKEARYVIQSLVIPQNAVFENVALDGKQHASTPKTEYSSVEEYNLAKGLTGSQAKDENWWNDEATETDKTKTPAGTDVAAVSTDSKPYMVLTYTIQQLTDAEGNDISPLPTPETFVVYYNLANAFGLQEGNLAFNEGWQNTLNIIIKPAEIQFCAQVAEWSTYERGLTVD